MNKGNPFLHLDSFLSYFLLFLFFFAFTFLSKVVKILFFTLGLLKSDVRRKCFIFFEIVFSFIVTFCTLIIVWLLILHFLEGKRTFQDYCYEKRVKFIDNNCNTYIIKMLLHPNTSEKQIISIVLSNVLYFISQLS